MAVQRVLPVRLESADGLVLRRWVGSDVESLARAVAESADHLRPWMAWVAQEPLPLAHRRKMIDEWERDRLRGGDVVMGVFRDGHVAGGCGLHHRIGRDGLEIGYWIHSAFLRQGIATAAVRLLTDAALALPGITHVEIHHDKANEASAGVPRKLGYKLVSRVPEGVVAPAEVGISCHWRITRKDWKSPTQ